MKSRRMMRGLSMMLMMTVMFLALSGLVMLLWNWLAPEVFGWHRITFVQALGLFLLSKILFGGFRGGWGHRGRRSRMKERWEHMTLEEREKFRKGMMGCMFSGRRSAESGGVEPGAGAQSPAAGS